MLTTFCLRPGEALIIEDGRFIIVREIPRPTEFTPELLKTLVEGIYGFDVPDNISGKIEDDEIIDLNVPIESKQSEA